MKPDRTGFFVTFPHPIYGTFAPVKLSLEYPIGEGETEQLAWDCAKKSTEEWFNLRYPSPDGVIVKATITKDNPPDPEIEHSLKDAIFQMQKIKYKEDAEEFLATEIWMKYNKELKSLVNAKPNRT